MTFLSAFKNTFLLWVLFLIACGGPLSKLEKNNERGSGVFTIEQNPAIIVAAQRTANYLPLLTGKKVAIVANQTSVILNEKISDTDTHTHLVDSLLSLGIDIEKVFAPEHGFRGRADAGETVEDGIDKKTGLPLISLYGSNKKPNDAQLENIDLVLFDIQDVGVRFYTYIATLQLVMEACAKHRIPVVLLDRPNPNGHYVDGPTMEKEFTGFLGLTPIPLVYGMTIGEYAGMINGEGWLQDKLKVELTVIPLKNYTHNTAYELPIRPSPNLPNSSAINLYPSLGLFEGTNINAGRGTEFQFQRFGAPFLNREHYKFSYTPQSNFGAKNPKHKEVLCYGQNLSDTEKLNNVRLHWLIDAYQNCTDKDNFFNTANFSRHAGTARLQEQIENSKTEAEIRESWAEDLASFNKIRAKYLIYD
ncbi:MAG: exo-beta-N-acetylmuramidase NamZ family protein [Flavobacteriaceae bacterium]